MLKTRTLALAVAALAGAASIANAQLALPFTITGTNIATNNKSHTSIVPISPSAMGYAWTFNISPQAFSVTGNIFGSNVAMPLVTYGVNPTSLVASGTAFAPGTLMNQRFTFTEANQPGLPVYDFNVKLDLQADLTLRTMVTVNSLSAFSANGITQSPVPTAVSAVNVGGVASIAVLPAPGPVALVSAGALLIARRRRTA